MTGLSMRLMRKVGLASLLIVLCLGLMTASVAAPTRIGEKEKTAYLTLAKHIPADCAFTAMAANLGETSRALEQLLQRYQRSDRSFQYEQFVSSLKGGLGFNPLSQIELAQTGLDPAYGLAAFSLSQDGAPLINMRFTNIVGGMKTLDAVIEHLAEGKGVPEQAYKEYRVRLFTRDGTPTGKLVAAYAVKSDLVYLMPEAPDTSWFERHLDAVSAILPGKSQAEEKAFTTLLARLDSGTSFISYSNYSAYYRELKRGSERLKTQLSKQSALSEIPGLDFLDDATAMAEGFTAQILAVSITPTKLSFVHQLNGPAKKVREIQALLRTGESAPFANLDVAGDPIGVFQSSINPQAMRDYLKKRSAAFAREYAKWNTTVAEKSKIDFDRELIDNLNGEVAAFFYGIGSLPESLINARSLNELDTLGLMRLVIVAGLKNPDTAKAMIERSLGAIRGQGQDVKAVSIPGVGEFLEMNPNGLPLSLGVHGKWIVLGIGRDAIPTAFAKRGGSLRLDKLANVSLFFKFKAFASAADRLKPPASSPNTQLHQQFKVWEEQVAAKLRFLDALDIRSTLLSDGFLTRGELRF